VVPKVIPELNFSQLEVENERDSSGSGLEFIIA